MAAGIAAGQQEQSHDGRNSRIATRIATCGGKEKLDVARIATVIVTRSLAAWQQE